MSTGDRPIYPLPKQRLDKKDLVAVSTTAQNNQARALGALFGGSGGLLTRLDVTLSYPLGATVVTFAPFECAWSTPNASDPDTFLGGVMTYDPARPAQVTTSWDIQAYVGAGVVFWAKRMSASAVVDNRAYYLNGVKYATTFTLDSEYVTILPVPIAGSAGIDNANGYFPIAYVKADGWAGIVPTVRPIYFPDSLFSTSAASIGRRNAWSVPDIDEDTGLPAADHVGRSLGAQMRWIFNALSRIHDSSWTFANDGRVTAEGALGWFDAPERGLSQLDAGVTDIEEDLVIVDGRLDDLEAFEDANSTPLTNLNRTKALYHARVDTDGTVLKSEYYHEDGAVWLKEAGDGYYRVTFHPDQLITKSKCIVQVTAESPTARWANYEWHASDEYILYVRVFNSGGIEEDCAFSISLFGWP
jgi:hypothetical protein